MARLLVVLTVFGALVGPARADDVPIATVGARTTLSAYGGWLVWSAHESDGRWRLMASHDGRPAQALPVARRDVAFDADVGPDADSKPAVVFSRCATDVVDESYAAPSRRPSAGCHVRILRLEPGAREKAAGIPRPGNASDTVPSIWRGHIAFQRFREGRTVSTIELWDPGLEQMRTLRHGPVPHAACPYRTGCAGVHYIGEVLQQDLGARVLAFLWEVQVPNVAGIGPGWQIRADPLGKGAPFALAGGIVSGTCGGSRPHSPQAVGSEVLWLSAEFDGECGATTTRLRRAGRTGSAWATPVAAGVERTWALARDGAVVYGLRGPDRGEPGGDGPLTIVRKPAPAFTPTRRPFTNVFY
jgi:hypothetical protein